MTDDFSKRANLQGVREERLAAPDGVPGAQWGINLAMRDDTNPDFWRYTGEASIVDRPYTVRDMFGDFTETIHAGAFKRSLANDPLVSFVWMHDMATVMAQTRGGGLELTASPNLGVDARLSKADADAQRLNAKSDLGLASAMSFAFRVTDQEWNADYTVRDILAVELNGGDVSAIATGHGANPAAHGSMRALDFEAIEAWLADQPDDQRAEFVARMAPEPLVDYQAQWHAERVALEAMRRSPLL